MKKTIHIILLFFLATTLQAQICNEQYDFNNKAENGLNIHETTSGFVMCGTRKDSFNYPFIGLVFYDQNCSVIGTKSYGKKYHYYFPGTGGSMIKTFDNGFALGGNIKDSLNNVNALLLKFDENGDTLWSKLFGDGINEWIAYQVKQTSDSGYILVGVKGGTTEDAFLIKTDSLGNEQWRNTYGTSATEYGFTVMCTSDGGYLIGGNHCNVCNATEGQISIFKVNASGTLVWQKQFGNPLYNEAGAIVGHEYPNGDYLFGQHYAYAQWNNKMAIYRISPSGNLVWRKDLSDLAGVSVGINSIKSLSDSVVLIGGFDQDDNFVLDGIMCKVDYNGNIMMKRHYNLTNANFDQFSDVIQCSDGTYAMAGTVSDGQQDMWFVHTDRYGCLEPDCWKNDAHNSGLEYIEPINVGIQELYQEQGINIYPNPADDYLIIELGENFRGTVNVFSIDGKLIGTLSCNKGFAYLETSELVPGIYFIQTVSEEKPRSAKFIIQR